MIAPESTNEMVNGDYEFLAEVLRGCTASKRIAPRDLDDIIRCARAIDPGISVRGVALLVRAAVPVAMTVGLGFLIGKQGRGALADVMRDPEIREVLRPFEGGEVSSEQLDLLARDLMANLPIRHPARFAIKDWFWGHPALARRRAACAAAAQKRQAEEARATVKAWLAAPNTQQADREFAERMLVALGDGVLPAAYRAPLGEAVPATPMRRFRPPAPEAALRATSVLTYYKNSN